MSREWSYLNGMQVGQPYDKIAAEKALILLNSLPGVAASIDVKRSDTEKGKLDLIISVEHTPLSAFIEINNRGSKVLGREQVETNLTLRDSIGALEQLSFNSAHTLNGDLNYYQLGVQLPYGQSGALISAQSSRTLADPSDFYAPSKIIINAESHRLAASHPLRRTIKSSITTELSYQLSRSHLRLEKRSAFSDKIHSLSWSNQFLLISSSGTTRNASLAITQSLDNHNYSFSYTASEPVETQIDDFTIFDVSATQHSLIQGKHRLTLSLDGQYSSKPTPASQRFLFGGKFYGGAYDPAELSGDQGIKAKAEIKTPVSMPLFSSFKKWGYGYYDLGKVWQAESNDGESAASAGLGLILKSKHWSAQIEANKALTRGISLEDDDKAIRLFASLRAAF